MLANVQAHLTFERWRRSWAALDVVVADPRAFDELLARYAEPHRAYHTRQHLEECFAHWDAVRGSASRPGEVELALWFHDAVYDPRREDNEGKSAELAREAILRAGLDAAVADRVEALILATRHATPPAAGDAAADAAADASALVDVDLAILAASAERFDEYERQVRSEYAWVPAPLFRWKRRTLLQELLDRPRLFSTAHFQQVAERPARANLRRSIAQLQG